MNSFQLIENFCVWKKGKTEKNPVIFHLQAFQALSMQGKNKVIHVLATN